MIFQSIVKLPDELKNATVSEFNINTNTCISTNIEQTYVNIHTGYVDITFIILMHISEFNKHGGNKTYMELDIEIGNYKGKLQLQQTKPDNLTIELSFKVTGISEICV